MRVLMLVLVAVASLGATACAGDKVLFVPSITPRPAIYMPAYEQLPARSTFLPNRMVVTGALTDGAACPCGSNCSCPPGFCPGGCPAPATMAFPPAAAPGVIYSRPIAAPPSYLAPPRVVYPAAGGVIYPSYAPAARPCPDGVCLPGRP